MSWSFTNDPKNVIVDAIRVEIYDIDEDNPLISDEIIEYAYDEENSILNAAARCCEILAAKFSNSVDKRLGPLSVSLSDKAEKYSSLAKELRAKAKSTYTGVPYAGGISDDKADTFEEDTDLVQPEFSKGMMDND